MADPFQREAQLELRSTYYPLGFPLQLKTNCEQVRNAAGEIWGGGQLFDEAPLELRVIVERGGAAPARPVYRAQAHLMSAVSDAGNFAICDYTRGLAVCRLNERAAQDREFVSYYYLRALINYCLTQLHLTPVHGACVSRAASGILLCGESGAGKTSLAYLCARNGWTYVSDNESWLAPAGGNLLVGDPRRIRFRETAASLFPELSGKTAHRDANGKQSIELAPSELGPIATADSCRITRVVFLSRQPEGSAAVAPFSRTAERLLSEIPLYEDHVRERHRASLEQISRLDPVELRYSRLEEAAQRLESLVK